MIMAIYRDLKHPIGCPHPMQADNAQAALGEPSMVHWSASHAEVTFVGRMLGSALLAMTAWTYSLEVRCLAWAHSVHDMIAMRN